MKTKRAIGELRWNGKVWRRWNGRRWAKALYSRDPRRLLLATPLDQDSPVDAAAREHLLAQAVEMAVADGGRVAYVGPTSTVIGRRQPVSHVMHGLLTLLTGGLWGVVWIAMCLARSEQRFRLEADDWGHVWASTSRATR